MGQQIFESFNRINRGETLEQHHIAKFFNDTDILYLRIVDRDFTFNLQNKKSVYLSDHIEEISTMEESRTIRREERYGDLRYLNDHGGIYKYQSDLHDELKNKSKEDALKWLPYEKYKSPRTFEDEGGNNHNQTDSDSVEEDLPHFQSDILAQEILGYNLVASEMKNDILNTIEALGNSYTNQGVYIHSKEFRHLSNGQPTPTQIPGITIMGGPGPRQSQLLNLDKEIDQEEIGEKNSTEKNNTAQVLFDELRNLIITVYSGGQKVLNKYLTNNNFYMFTTRKELLDLSIDELRQQERLKVRYLQVDTRNRCVPMDWFFGYDTFSIYSFVKIVGFGESSPGGYLKSLFLDKMTNSESQDILVDFREEFAHMGNSTFWSHYKSKIFLALYCIIKVSAIQGLTMMIANTIYKVFHAVMTRPSRQNQRSKKFLARLIVAYMSYVCFSVRARAGLISFTVVNIVTSTLIIYTGAFLFLAHTRFRREVVINLMIYSFLYYFYTEMYVHANLVLLHINYSIQAFSILIHHMNKFSFQFETIMITLEGGFERIIFQNIINQFRRRIEAELTTEVNHETIERLRREFEDNPANNGQQFDEYAHVRDQDLVANARDLVIDLITSNGMSMLNMAPSRALIIRTYFARHYMLYETELQVHQELQQQRHQDALLRVRQQRQQQLLERQRTLEQIRSRLARQNAEFAQQNDMNSDDDQFMSFRTQNVLNRQDTYIKLPFLQSFDNIREEEPPIIEILSPTRKAKVYNKELAYEYQPFRQNNLQQVSNKKHHKRINDSSFQLFISDSESDSIIIDDEFLNYASDDLTESEDLEHHITIEEQEQ